MSRKLLTMVALALVAPIALTACGGGDDEGPIKVGVLLPFTGAGAFLADSAWEGIQLYFETEAGGEIEGRTVQLIREDTQVDAATGVSKMRKLIEQDQVDVVIGPMFSHVGLAVKDMVIAAGIPQIYPVPGSLGEHCTSGCGPESRNPAGEATRSPLIFRTDYDAELAQPQLSQPLFNERGYRSASWISFDYAAGHYITENFVSQYADLGGTTNDELYVPFDIVDFGPQLLQIQQSKPDVVLAFLFGPAVMSLFEQAKQFDVFPGTPIFIINPVTDFEASSVGDAAIGVRMMSHYSPLTPGAANESFVNSFEGRFNKPPNPWTVDGYLAAKSYGLAVEETGGDTEEGLEVAEEMQKQVFDSPRGQFRYDPNGFAEVTMYEAEVVQEGGEVRVRLGAQLGVFNSTGKIR